MKYIAFLRGVNVGGHTKVEMAKLKKAFEDLGFTEVKTLLNSGNVIFESSTQPPDIEENLEKVFGFKISVILRSKDQIEKLVKKDPFKKININLQTRLYITFTDKEDLISHLDIGDNENTTDLMKSLEKEYGKRITT
jgi:uncharacterized protein (DUF1697 family)